MIKRRYLFLLLVPLAVISLFTGVGEMNITGLLAGNIHEWQLFWTSRLPRLMAILVAGAGLSVCGLIMQSLSRNRFVSPTTAGLYDCARLGVLISIILLPAASIFIKTGFAILVTLIGALANRFVLAGIGEDFATNLGLNYKQTLFLGLVLVSVITGVVIVTVGAIPFLGLIVPNIVSLYLGDNIRKTLSHTAILGALLVLVCDLFGRIVIYPYEVSVSLIMGVLGSVLFLWLLLRRYCYA